MDYTNKTNVEDTVARELLEFEQNADIDEDVLYEKLHGLRDRLEMEFHRVMEESPLDDRLTAIDSLLEKISESLLEMRS